MSIIDIACYRAQTDRLPSFMRATWLRDQGVSFRHAYFILFNRTPRI